MFQDWLRVGTSTGQVKTHFVLLKNHILIPAGVAGIHQALQFQHKIHQSRTVRESFANNPAKQFPAVKAEQKVENIFIDPLFRQYNFLCFYMVFALAIFVLTVSMSFTILLIPGLSMLIFLLWRHKLLPHR